MNTDFQVTIVDSKLEEAIDAKERYQRLHRIAHLPNFFELGDKVGFFLLDDPDLPLEGKIVQEDASAVTVETKERRRHRVSPFLIFRLR